MDNKAFRFERIERLLRELEYEVTRGVLEGDLESESMGFQKIIPVSHEITGGIVFLEFSTRPMHRDSILGRQLNIEPRLRLIPGGKNSEG